MFERKPPENTNERLFRLKFDYIRDVIFIGEKSISKDSPISLTLRRKNYLRFIFLDRHQNHRMCLYKSSDYEYVYIFEIMLKTRE